ncbi:MAG: esterase/lipase family protein [Telluria sp.]
MSDLNGISRLAADAVVGVTDIAEALHLNILEGSAGVAGPVRRPLSGAASLAYGGVRGVTRLVGAGVDAVLSRLARDADGSGGWPGREPARAVLNGVLGDHLAQTGNPLALGMDWWHDGKLLNLNPPALDDAIPKLNGRILVLAHGLCMSEGQWRRNEHDHGAALARDRGWTPVYLRYNSGLHVSTNGRAFAAQLEQLVAAWPEPVESLAILGHSMGGLVARSACHYAAQDGQHWLRHLRAMVFLGTPHHGAPLERGGNWFHLLSGLSTYTAPFSAIGKIRSAGITDLRHGSVLDEDWLGQDRFAHLPDQRVGVPLPAHVACHAVAVTLGKRRRDKADRLLGDGLVPVDSALGRHANPALDLAIPASRQWTGYGLGHLDLLDNQAVYRRLLDWL